MSGQAGAGAFGNQRLNPGFQNPTGNLPAVTAVGPYATIQTNPIAATGYDPGASYSPPYAYSYPDPYGGYLRGGADVINAQGRFMVNNQQALLLHESVRQARMESRRRIFDEWLYERANRPTLEDDRERDMREQVRRSRNDPPLTEIWSADALNSLLRDIQKLDAKGEKGRDVMLDEDILKRVNVTKGKGNVGILKNEAQLNWPLALRTEETKEAQQQLDSLVKDAVNQAMNSRSVSRDTLVQIDDALKQLRDRLSRQVSDLPFAQYREAKRFLNDLEEARTVLGGQDAGNYLTGKYAAKGKSVTDLVRYMTQQGLLFAPATSGDEAAYTALHRALAAYDMATAGSLATERESR